MAMGVTSLLSRSVPAATFYDHYQAKAPELAGLSRAQKSCTLAQYAAGCSNPRTRIGRTPLDPALRHAVIQRPVNTRIARSNTVTVSAASESSSNGTPERKRTLAKDFKSLREKASDYIEQKSGYFWLGGPILATAAVAIPPVVVTLTSLLQANFLAGLLTTFVFDALFVLAADLFFVGADRAGHQQTIAGGPAPWIGPWEYTGYPKGEPVLTKVVASVGVAIGLLGVLVSLFLGKLAVGLPAFASYLALIFVQVAYERLLSNDRVPAYPLVPLVYTAYRFKQLARATELVRVLGGGAPLAFIINALTLVWTFYLGLQLTQLPWLYSTWNSNKAT